MCATCGTKHHPDEPHNLKTKSPKRTGQKTPITEPVEEVDPDNYNSNRQLGLGRAPGVDLAAMYRVGQPKLVKPGFKPKRIKHKNLNIESEFSKALNTVQADFRVNEPSEKSQAVLPFRSKSVLTESAMSLKKPQKPVPIIYQSINGIDMSL